MRNVSVDRTNLFRQWAADGESDDLAKQSTGDRSLDRLLHIQHRLRDANPSSEQLDGDLAIGRRAAICHEQLRH